MQIAIVLYPSFTALDFMQFDGYAVFGPAGALTPAATAAKNHRCQPPASLRKLNAAPVLWVSVRFTNGTRGSGSWNTSSALASHLLSWSSATTAAESQSQRTQANRRFSPSPATFSTQRPQSSGCSG